MAATKQCNQFQVKFLAYRGGCHAPSRTHEPPTHTQSPIDIAHHALPREPRNPHTLAYTHTHAHLCLLCPTHSSPCGGRASLMATKDIMAAAQAARPNASLDTYCASRPSQIHTHTHTHVIPMHVCVCVCVTANAKTHPWTVCQTTRIHPPKAASMDLPHERAHTHTHTHAHMIHTYVCEALMCVCVCVAIAQRAPCWRQWQQSC